MRPTHDSDRATLSTPSYSKYQLNIVVLQYSTIIFYADKKEQALYTKFNKKSSIQKLLQKTQKANGSSKNSVSV
jgi:hypothetical protein